MPSRPHPRKYVVVVGGGPVGVALALDLGLRGVSRAVVERRTQLSPVPKGQGLSQRTMEHFRAGSPVVPGRPGRQQRPRKPHLRRPRRRSRVAGRV